MKKDNTPSDLPEIAKEIVLALLDGDWARYSDDSGKHFYYIIGERDHGIEFNDLHAFNNMLVFRKYEPDAFENWYIQAALAEEPPDRLARARKRVVEAGVDPAFFDAVIEAPDLRAILEELMPQFVRNDNWDALIAVLEAVRIERTRQRHIFVSQSDRPGLREALEARFLTGIFGPTFTERQHLLALTPSVLIETVRPDSMNPEQQPIDRLSYHTANGKEVLMFNKLL